MSQQPAHNLRISNISATIWRNIGDNGNTWYSVNLQRSYKTTDDEWRRTESMGFDDLLTAAKLLSQAHDWIAEASGEHRGKKQWPTS